MNHLDVKVEFLYFKTCPSYKVALERLSTVLRECNIDAQVEMTEVNSTEDAQRLRFLGSPTIRINGLDVERSARERTNYGLTCRMYETNVGLDGSPSIETIREAVLEHLCEQAQSSD
jgi:hypothetical protein